MLEQNGRDGKATSNDLMIREVISCPFGDCESSYTLSYTLEEIRTVGAEKNVDKMRRTATDEIEKEHLPTLQMLSCGEPLDRDQNAVGLKQIPNVPGQRRNASADRIGGSLCGVAASADSRRLGDSRSPRTDHGAQRFNSNYRGTVLFRIGVQLTEGFLMDQEASVRGLVFHHPDCTYFSVGGSG